MKTTIEVPLKNPEATDYELKFHMDGNILTVQASGLIEEREFDIVQIIKALQILKGIEENE